MPKPVEDPEIKIDDTYDSLSSASQGMSEQAIEVPDFSSESSRRSAVFGTVLRLSCDSHASDRGPSGPENQPAYSRV
jgi:hypothetical protein